MASSTFSKIPVEVAENWSQYLDASDLSSFRLVCRQTNAQTLHIFAQRFLSTLTTSLMGTDLTRLEELAGNPNLRKYVKNICIKDDYEKYYLEKDNLEKDDCEQDDGCKRDNCKRDNCKRDDAHPMIAAPQQTSIPSSRGVEAFRRALLLDERLKPEDDCKENDCESDDAQPMMAAPQQTSTSLLNIWPRNYEQIIKSNDLGVARLRRMFLDN